MEKETKEITQKRILLIAFYNILPIGLKYIESFLLKQGYSVKVIFFKSFRSFNSPKFQEATPDELELLKKSVEEFSPELIGLSVASSVYLKTVNAVLNKIKDNFSTPIFIGGPAATLNPDYFLDFGVNFVIRSDGEFAVSSLIDAVINKKDYENIPSLCFIKDNKKITNEIETSNNIEDFGIPTVCCQDVDYIDRNSITKGDPSINDTLYETVVSRGCPYNCTYCSAPLLRRKMPDKIKAMRLRDVKSVIKELEEAKNTYKKLTLIRFQDEIFPIDHKWIDEFAEAYKKNIKIPFTIWAHPKMVDEYVLKKLVEAGLIELTMGIQSGSENIRQNIFNRPESNTDILKATEIISKSGINWSLYDFIIRSPFETLEDIKQSYLLLKNIPGKYISNIRYFYFLPYTEIVDMAIDRGYYSKEEIESMMYAPTLVRPFDTGFKLDNSIEFELWHKMMFCVQFKKLRKSLEKYENDPCKHRKEIEKIYTIGKIFNRLRNFKRRIIYYFKTKNHL